MLPIKSETGAIETVKLCIGGRRRLHAADGGKAQAGGEDDGYPRSSDISCFQHATVHNNIIYKYLLKSK